MLVKTIVVALAFAIIGSKAEVANKKLAGALLEYNNRMSNTAMNSAAVYALSDFSKQVSDLLEKNMKNLDIESLLGKISLFTNSITKQLSFNKSLLDEVENLRTTLSASALQVNNLFSTISEELLVKFALYFEDLQVKVEKNALIVSKKLESITVDLNTKLITNTDSMQSYLNLQNLESTILESLEEVRVHLNAYSEKVSEKLSQQSLILVNNVSPYGDAMKESLRKTFEATCFKIKKVVDEMQTNFLVKASQLKEQVSFFKMSLRKTYLDATNAKKTTNICLTDMSQKVLLLKESVILYGDALKKALVDGLEDMKKVMGLYSVQDSTNTLDNNIQEKILSIINSTLFINGSS